MASYKIEVDLMLCQGHGVCREECPEVFDVKDMQTGYCKVLVKQRYPDESLLEKVQAAVDYCPNQTIRLVEVAD